MQAVKEMVPKFEFVISSDPIEYQIDKFIKNVKRRMAKEMLLELGDRADQVDGGEDIDIDFLDAARQLATIVPSTKVARFSEMSGTDREVPQRQGRRIALGNQDGHPLPRLSHDGHSGPRATRLRWLAGHRQVHPDAVHRVERLPPGQDRAVHLPGDGAHGAAAEVRHDGRGHELPRPEGSGTGAGLHRPLV